MIKVKKAQEHYEGKSDWLTTYHHFSFAEYFDPNNVNFGPLRVFNDDLINAGSGFDFHQHRDMEIVTYVIDGILEHKDSLGNQGLVHPGEIQRMSAGTGVFHSEFNHSDKMPLRLLQMWVFSDTQGLEPSWEQKKYTKDDRKNKMLPVIGPKNSGQNGRLTIHQDAVFYISNLEAGHEISHLLDRGRIAYLFIIGGKITLDGMMLDTQDAAQIENELTLKIKAVKEAELILIDLPVQYKKNSILSEAVQK